MLKGLKTVGNWKIWGLGVVKILNINGDDKETNTTESITKAAELISLLTGVHVNISYPILIFSSQVKIISPLL